MTGNTREIVKRFNIRLTKSLGQNFLTDENMVRNIVDAAEIISSDVVIEIGAGVGSMTGELASRAYKVITIEIDKHLIPALAENLKDYTNVEIINEDVMKVNIKELIIDRYDLQAHRIKVVANLPYYITTPIIMKLLEENPGIDAMVFMVQREVAERMTAKPGGKDYGALSVAVQFYSSPKKVFDVPPHCFIPQPEVYSTVIELDIYKKPPVEVIDKNLFFRTVKASFGQRRKTLVNALFNSGYFMKSKEEITEILRSIGIGEKQRGETLSILQFSELSNSLFIKKS